MKLHLPIALLAAIVSAQFACAQASASGVTFDNSNPGHANVTISENAGDLTGYYMYGTYSNKPVAQGVIGAAASVQDTDGNAPIEKFESATITMNGGKLNTLSGYGIQGNAVTGDTTVIMNGGSTNLIVGGTVQTSGANRDTSVYGISPEGWTASDFTFKSNYGKEDDETIQKQNINIQVNGGTVGQIRGTHSGHSQVFLYTKKDSNTPEGYLTTLHKSGDQAAIEQYMQSNPLALSGNVNIAVNGGSIIAKNAGKDETVAIYGGGGTGYSVDGSVNIAVGGTANIVGDIIAGSSNNYTFVGSTNTVISGGSIVGNVYGGGDGSDPKSTVEGGIAPTVKNGTTVVLSGGTIDGNVYAAGLKDQVNGGTNVVIKNGGTKVTGTISGMGVDSDVNGERLLSIENSGGINVSWNQFQDFNAVEFKNSEIEFGTLSKDFEKVSAEGSWLQGSFEDGKVQLNANNSWLEIAGDLTTTKDSSITNTKKPMTVGGDATFQGTKIENADIVAGGNLSVNSYSEVTDSNLVAADGKVTISYSSMNGGTITTGDAGLELNRSDVVVDTINGGEETYLKMLTSIETGSTLVVNDDLKLAEGSAINGFSGMGQFEPAMNSVTAKSISMESKLQSGQAGFVNLTATEGNITIGAGNNAADGTIVAKDSVILKDGAQFNRSDVTAQEGNIILGAGTSASDSKLVATTGGITVTDSALNNNDLKAANGTITISGSKVVNSAYHTIVGETIKIENSTIDSQASNKQLVIKGNTEVTNSDIVSTGGIISFNGSSLVLDSDSTVNAQKGSIQFWGDSVTSNGAKLTTEEGHYQVYSQFIANQGTEISTGSGAMHFRGELSATGTTITAGEGHIYTYGNVNLVGSEVTADKGYVRFGNGNDVISAENTTFIANKGQEITFGNSGAVKVELKGGNVLQSAEGTNGIIRFMNSSEVVSNGSNTIDAVVVMANGTKLTAESGVLNIATHGTSHLQNLQQTGNAEINVTANGGTLNLKGTSSIESLTANNATSNITGSLTTTELALNGGTMNVGTATGERTELVLNIPGTVDTNINGVLNVTNTDLKVKGSDSSQFWIGSGADGSMTVTGGSYVDLSRGTTLGLGGSGQDVSAGKLTVAGESTLIGGSNNLWVYGNSEIHVTEGSEMYACSGGDHYNYRVLLGLTDDVTDTANQTITVDKGGSFTSYAYEFVSNFHPSSTVTINVDGEGSTFTQENTMNCGTYMGTNKTTTYLVDSGYDHHGNKPNYVNDVFVNLNATKGGKIDFKSDVTYVGSALDQEKGKTNKQLSIAIDGNEKSSVSFRDMEIYANTVIENEGGSFTAEDIKVHEGAIFSHEGNGKITAASIGVEGTMLIGSEDGGRTQMTLYVPVTGTASYSGKINGQLTIDNADFVVKGEVASQFGIGIGGEGSMLVTGGSKVNLSNGSTLVMGRNGGAGSLTVADGSTLIGGANNLWVFGNSDIHVTGEGSKMEVSSGKEHYNYRVLLGMTNSGDATTEQTILVDKGASFTSHAYEFVSHFHGGSTVNIVADGANSTFTQANTMNTGTFMGTNKTTTYLLDSGTDANGNKYGAVDHVKANITASNGGKVSFDSEKTYVGSAQDKALGYTDKKLNITVADKDSSVSFKAMEIYADTTIDNKGDKDDFFASSVSVYDGATLETYGSLDLNDVAISGGTLYSHGSLDMDSLVMENATMLFAVSSLEVTQAMINYNGADLTGYRTGTISAADMIQNFGIVLSGAAVDTLMQQWETAVEFSFTLAQGSELFEKEFAYVLEQNLAEFTITLGEDALVDYALTVDNLKVVDDENGVHIIGTVTIPEPTTATLSLLALAALAARRRRR